MVDPGSLDSLERKLLSLDFHMERRRHELLCLSGQEQFQCSTDLVVRRNLFWTC